MAKKKTKTSGKKKRKKKGKKVARKRRGKNNADGYVVKYPATNDERSFIVGILEGDTNKIDYIQGTVSTDGRKQTTNFVAPIKVSGKHCNFIFTLDNVTRRALLNTDITLIVTVYLMDESTESTPAVAVNVLD